MPEPTLQSTPEQIPTFQDRLDTARGYTVDTETAVELAGEVMSHHQAIARQRKQLEKLDRDRELRRLGSYARVQQDRLQSFLASRGLDYSQVHREAAAHVAELEAEEAADAQQGHA